MVSFYYFTFVLRNPCICLVNHTLEGNLPLILTHLLLYLNVIALNDKNDIQIEVVTLKFIHAGAFISGEGGTDFIG